jgi:hypothetical protein
VRVEPAGGGEGVNRGIIIDGIRVGGDEAKRIIDEAAQDARDAGRARSVFALVALIILILIAAIGSGWIAAIVIRYFVTGAFPLWTWVIATSLLTALGVGLAYYPLMRPFHTREIRRAMIRRGFELCPQCGYWLKGLGPDSEHCPECGAEREKDAR